jgi:predicted metal-binding protein
MYDTGQLVAQFKESCRKAHEYMSHGDFSRGVRFFDRMSMLMQWILASGDEGREMLFALVEGDDLPVAIHAANCMFNQDPGRCRRALRAIISKDDGFFAYSARFMLRHRHKSMERLKSEMTERTRKMLARAAGR